MRRAHDWLTSGHDSIARIAEQCGYDSEAAFAKVFNRYIGVGPGTARRTGRVVRARSDRVRARTDE